jgi:hypothetical protein
MIPRRRPRCGRAQLNAAGLGDALRGLNRVPGLAQNSLSAASRGGDGDETRCCWRYPLRQPYACGYQNLFSVH